MICDDELYPLAVPPPRPEPPPVVATPPRPIAPAKSRWVRCPHCGSPAAVLAVSIACTGKAEVCRWADEEAYREWIAAGQPEVE